MRGIVRLLRHCMGDTESVPHLEPFLREQVLPPPLNGPGTATNDEAPAPEPTPKGHEGVRAAIQEEEISLVQRVFLTPDSATAAAVVFCGVEHGNGCTWTCARASETLAAYVEERVCVVDADFRSPSLHSHFGLENNEGLTEAVLESRSLLASLRQLPQGNLWVLTAGSAPQDPRPMLASKELRLRLIELRSLFKYVLIDAPPLFPYADACFLGQVADGVVLVLEANSTRREAARKAKAKLEAAQLDLLAAVLNKRAIQVSDTLYRRLLDLRDRK